MKVTHRAVPLRGLRRRFGCECGYVPIVDQVERQKILVDLHLLLCEAGCIGHRPPGDEVQIQMTHEGRKRRRAAESLRVDLLSLTRFQQDWG